MSLAERRARGFGGGVVIIEKGGGIRRRCRYQREGRGDSEGVSLAGRRAGGFGGGVVIIEKSGKDFRFTDIDHRDLNQYVYSPGYV